MMRCVTFLAVAITLMACVAPVQAQYRRGLTPQQRYYYSCLFRSGDSRAIGILERLLSTQDGRLTEQGRQLLDLAEKYGLIKGYQEGLAEGLRAQIDRPGPKPGVDLPTNTPVRIIIERPGPTPGVEVDPGVAPKVKITPPAGKPGVDLDVRGELRNIRPARPSSNVPQGRLRHQVFSNGYAAGMAIRYAIQRRRR